VNDMTNEIIQSVNGLPPYNSAKELTYLLKQKSMETWEHSLRVSYYCRIIGRKIELSNKSLSQLSVFAVFHDIGKLCVSDDILQKSGGLTPREWEEMKKHSQTGCQIAKAIPETFEISKYILHHHEHWDGSGYPQGLRKKEISLLCRILAVSDAFDAMTNDRVYRKAMKKEEAVQELKRNAGIQFDPDIVKIFLDSVIN
jgi:diguanylate cyclase